MTPRDESVQPVGLDVSIATAAPECKHCWHTLSTQHDFWRPEFDHQSAVAETTRTKSLCCRCGMVTSSSLYSARLDDRVHQTRFLVDGSSGAEDGD